MAGCNVSVLVGQILISITRHGDYNITFTTTSGKRYMMSHLQDCCESVTIEDVVGDFDDLIGTPILVAEEATSKDPVSQWPNGAHDELKAMAVTDALTGSSRMSDDSETWTFYRFQTIKGAVSIRWYGTSNGYYSESVDFTEY